MSGRLRRGRALYPPGRLPPGFQRPISLRPPWKKSNRVLSEAKPKAGVWSFCFTLKLSPVDPTPPAAAPTAAGPTWSSVFLEERENTRTNEASVGVPGETEKLSFVPGNYTTLGLGRTRSFYKIASQRPRLPQASDRPGPHLVGLTGRCGQAPPPAVPPAVRYRRADRAPGEVSCALRVPSPAMWE